MITYQLLEDREERALFQKSLCDKYKSPIAVIKANIPGENKIYPESLWSTYNIFGECIKRFSGCNAVHKVLHSFSSEGLIFFIVLKCGGERAKETAMEIEENHPLGRLTDIDIIEKEKFFSRGRNFRTCFLCNKPAIICSREKTHSLEELNHFIKTKVHAQWSGNLTKRLALLSEAALISELCRKYGFGCVTANSTGSHSDMDFLLMLKCIPFISKTIRNLNDTHCAGFDSLRTYGKQAERELIKLTGGINTYKGALFLLLILNACVCRLTKYTTSFSCLQHEIAKFSHPLKNDFEKGLYSKASKELFIKEKTRGIRELAIDGFFEHFNSWLPMLQSGINPDFIYTRIAAKTWDSTIVKRKGIKTLLEFKNRALKTSTTAGFEELEKFCLTQNISTGGTADKIILLWNLHLLKNILLT